MGRELKHAGSFRDADGQDWEIGVYQDMKDGRLRYDTVVQSPNGQQFRPEEDILGDFHLIDSEGNEHDVGLPMSMDALQAAVEAVEDVAWGRKAPAAMQQEGKLTAGERDKWEGIVENFDKPASKAAAKQEPPAEKAGGWRERIAQMKENLSQSRGRG